MLANGIIGAVGTFYRTQVILPREDGLNRLANSTLSYVQYLIGQETIQLKDGELQLVPSKKDNYPWIVTAAKCVYYACMAIPMTVIGTIARALSCDSPTVRSCLFADRVSLIVNNPDPVARMSLIEMLPVSSREKILDQAKIADSLRPAIAFLAADFPTRFNADYPFPFALAEKLKTIPSDRIPQELMTRFTTLLGRCSREQETAEKKMLEELDKIVRKAFVANVKYFRELFKKTGENDGTLTSWLEEQKSKPDYSYPFFTTPKLFPVLTGVKGLEAFKAGIYTTCIQTLNHLPSYVNEQPPSDHPRIKPLMETIAQLKNHLKIRELFVSCPKPSAVNP